jgi:Ca-activated chloride channel family protein
MRHIHERIKLLPNSALVLLLIFFAFSNVSYAQEDVLRVDTNLVTIPVTVIDRDGRYVTNLGKPDFQVFEDGVEQEIAYFEPTVQPFTALLLLDTSGSMNNYLANLVRAANAFISQLRDDDQLIVATFSDSKRIQVLLEPTKKRDMRLKILLQRRIGDGYTATFDAVEGGIKYMRNIQGRRAIILFSDGEQYGKKASAKSNLRDAEEQGALIYTIRFGAYPTHQPGYTGNIGKKEQLKLIEKVNGYMQSLAQKTGGHSYQVDDIRDLEKTFSTIAEELGQQYSLGFYPKKQPEAGQRRQIKVKMRRPNLVVLARDSYIVESTEKANQ